VALGAALLLFVALLAAWLPQAAVTRAATINGAITAADPTQTGRLDRNGAASACGTAKANPGIFTATGARGYNAYTYTNSTGAALCVTVTLTVPDASNLFSVAYAGSFNPADPTANYLADAGLSSGNGGTITYGFTLTPGQVAVIVVHAVNAGGTGAYTLTVTPGEQQAIAFAPLPDRTYGDPPVTVAATGGGSGNPVTFATTTPAVCTASGANGATITLVGVGTCTVTADQAGGGTYDPAPQVARSFAVVAPAPTLTAVAPATIAAGSGDTTVTLTGTGFAAGAGSVAYLDGVALATTRVDDTHLTAVVPAARLATAGQFPLNVVTPAPGGGTSNTVTLTVTNPAPALTGLAPTGAMAGAGDTALTLSGTGFAPGATVDFGGATLTPTAGNVSATTIVVTIPANLLTTARVVAVTVTNPGPGGGTSGAQNFTVAAPAPGAPQASVAPASLAFGAQQVGTASDSRQVTLTNGGGSALTIAGVTLTGANPGDFAVTFNTCVGTVPAGASCVVGVRFAPTAATARAATLSIADNAAGSPQTVALSGTGTAPPASPVPQSVVTASASGNGSVTPAGSTGYATGTQATYAAVPATGQTFVGWTLDGQYVGYASPLTFTVNANRTLVATFVATPQFSDLGGLSAADRQAVVFLAALGIVNPQGVNGSGRFEPARDVKRAEVAAFVARVFGWQHEFHANNFPDKCDAQGQNCVDDELWNNVAALKDYGIVGGYADQATCQSAGTTAPCYLPRDVVQRVQVVSVVARAFIKTPDLRPTGFWDRLNADTAQYTNVPNTGTQRSDLTTYRANVGTVPGQTSDATLADPTGNGTRLYLIQVLYAAFNAQFGTDRVP